MSKNLTKTQHMSVEEILESVRGVISKGQNLTESEEILELTNIVNQDDSPINSDTDEENDDHLLSNSTFEETAESFKNFAEKAKYAARNQKKSKALTIDEMVEQMMRPQLKEWLDKNLPLLVKELVEKEIKRLIPNMEEEE